MLEQPKGEKITTAALAARLAVSEAALYRHFASKAQMFEGLIEFIESTLFGLINQITTHEEDGFKQLRQILTMLLSFAERNPGMTRVIIGDALVTEDDRLQTRINQLVDRLELSIKQSFRTAVAQGLFSALTTLLVRQLSATESSTTITLWQSLLMGSFALMLLPLAVTFNLPPGNPRRIAIAYSAAMALVGLGVLVPGAPIATLIQAFVAGTVLSTWLPALIGGRR